MADLSYIQAGKPTLHNLYIFCVVFETRGFRSSARKLKSFRPNYTQEIVWAIEKFYGVELFDRAQMGCRSKLVPTNAGKWLYVQAKKLIEQHRYIDRQIRAHQEKYQIRPRLCFSGENWLIDMLLPVLPEVFPKRTLVPIRLRKRQTIMDILKDKDVEFALEIHRVEAPGYQSTEITRLPCSVYQRPDYEMPLDQPVTLISLNPFSECQRGMVEAANIAGFDVRMPYILPDLRQVLFGVAGGAGIGILPDLLADYGIQKIELENFSYNLPIYAIARDALNRK